jgi:hypothetical protein
MLSVRRVDPLWIARQPRHTKTKLVVERCGHPARHEAALSEMRRAGLGKTSARCRCGLRKVDGIGRRKMAEESAMSPVFDQPRPSSQSPYCGRVLWL